MRYCNFYGRFDFFCTQFLEEALFLYSHFYGSINFNSAEFKDCGHFAGVTFHEKSYPTFNQTKFKVGIFSEAKFEKPDYTKKVEFTKAIFEETIDFSHSEFFLEANFQSVQMPQKGKTDFESAKFHNSVNFGNVEFFEADFKRAKFAYDNKNFDKTIFKNCKFKKTASFVDSEFFQNVDFSSVVFENIHFEEAKFAGGVTFIESKFFEDVFFNRTEFGYRKDGHYRTGDVGFEGALFSENSRVFFDNTWFSRHAKFDYTYFKGYVFFSGNDKNPVFDSIFEDYSYYNLLNFLNTTIEKSEKIFFQNVRLRPSWFANIDLRKFNFTGIKWLDEKGNPITVPNELKKLNNQFTLLSNTFRQLADNAEVNSRFEEASNFRQMAFECERLERKEAISKWFQEPISCSSLLSKIGEKAKSFPYDFVHWLYRWTSGYGENRLWAFFILFLIVTISAIFYVTPLCEFPNGQNGVRSLDLLESIAYSLRVMVLQRPEPFPINNLGKVVLALESVFAPLQLALLALAIRRKFMR